MWIVVVMYGSKLFIVILNKNLKIRSMLSEDVSVCGIKKKEVVSKRLIKMCWWL